jgi:hypothetical protein
VAESDQPRRGLGFTEALLLLFIGLKLGGAIDWSWIWVLSPIWIALLARITLALGFITIARRNLR